LSTTWVSGRYDEIGKPALSRNRAPIGGYDGSLTDPASCRAGQTCLRSVTSVVNRMAWSTRPAFTSAYRRRPGRIGSPAASADVQPCGRSLLLVSDQVAPEPAVQWPSARR
jgi:hypothetical protein